MPRLRRLHCRGCELLLPADAAVRIGILTDVHDAVAFLDLVLERFRQEAVDAVVSIGDWLGAWRPTDATPM